MSIYPFKSGYEMLYNNGGFEIVFGLSEDCGDMRIGMRWTTTTSSENGYPVGKNGEPRYFILSQDFDITFLATLLGGGKENDKKIVKAIKTLIIQGEKK